jgi:hypothetical protein
LQDATAGDPIRGTKWTRKALRKLVEELGHKKFEVSHETVRRLLKTLDYSLRYNRKERSKRQDADRDRQMRYLARKRRAFLKAKKRHCSMITGAKIPPNRPPAGKLAADENTHTLPICLGKSPLRVFEARARRIPTGRDIPEARRSAQAQDHQAAPRGSVSALPPVPSARLPASEV